MISIAMATYNGAKYVQEQIDSILAQTIQDFELVVCDDCSTDLTWDILQAYAKNDSRIRAYRNEKNMGFKHNFEQAINLTMGEYVALSDQDDIWVPNHLEVLIRKMKGDVQLVCGRPVFVDENNKELPEKYDYLKKIVVPATNEDHARHIFLGRSTYQGASMLIRRSFLGVALPIPDGAKFHDSWFAALACFSGGMIYVDKIVMRYRRLGNSVTYGVRKEYLVKKFLRHLVRGRVLTDRLVFVYEIRKRVPSLSSTQLQLLSVFETMLKRQKSVWGRIANIPYRCKYFRKIYAGNIWD